MSVEHLEITEDSLKERKEERVVADYPDSHISIKPMGQKNYAGAVIIDESPSGLGMMTSLDLPLGMLVTLNKDDTYYALAEVRNVGDKIQEWEWNCMRRVGVHFLDKTNWS